MKKIITFILVLCTLLCVCSCNDNSGKLNDCAYSLIKTERKNLFSLAPYEKLGELLASEDFEDIVGSCKNCPAAWERSDVAEYPDYLFAWATGYYMFYSASLSELDKNADVIRTAYKKASKINSDAVGWISGAVTRGFKNVTNMSKENCMALAEFVQSLRETEKNDNNIFSLLTIELACYKEAKDTENIDHINSLLDKYKD